MSADRGAYRSSARGWPGCRSAVGTGLLTSGYWALEWLAVLGHELLLFAGIFFLIGAADEFAVDIAWLWLKLTGRAKTPIVERKTATGSPLAGPAVVFVPAWQEEEVIGDTIRHMLAAWPHRDLRIYVGCYRNDPATVEAIIEGIGNDPRVRMILHDRDGPSTKADCLNRIYAGLAYDEARHGFRARMVLLHDAEDLVDPAALSLLDRAMEEAEFVQLPVLPLVQRRSRWVAGHYNEEFAEAHGKAMVVRYHLSAGLPAAGVGCAFARDMLAEMAARFGNPAEPFSPECLTEDYELGLRVRILGHRSMFLRARGDDGRLVATRACFPHTLGAAVRQKARWIYGIAFQGWDRLGWSGHGAELWMRLRDRRGPFSALVLGCGYLLLLVAAILYLAEWAGYPRAWPLTPTLKTLLAINLGFFAWRALIRAMFTAREYGWIEACRAILRIPVANVIAILAGRRALFTYVRSLAGELPAWDKTRHSAHPELPGGGQGLHVGGTDR